MGGKKTKGEEQSLKSNMWMVTFSDLIMLLLTFFVLLLTMSSMDGKRLKGLISHFKGATGALELSGTWKVQRLKNLIRVYYKDPTSLIVIDYNTLSELLMPTQVKSKRKMQEIIDEFEEMVDITDDDRGIVLSFHENILFQAGETTIRKEVFPVLDAIDSAISDCPNNVRVMGHTDDKKVHSEKYGSNWELSSYRGLAVLDYFLKKKNHPPERFSVGGYGPSKPLHPNDSPKNRALNRRVEVIIEHLKEG